MLDINADSTDEEVKEWVYAIGRSSIVPPDELSVSDWADCNRVLTSKASAEPGQWRTDRTPYLRDIMDALSINSPYEWIVFKKGAQIGGTEVGLNWLGYIIDRVPGPTMIVWPTDNDIKTNVAIRIDPFVDSTPCIKDKVGDAGSKDGANNMFLKEFPGGFLSFSSANSSASLRSKPVRFLFIDELDEYPWNVNGQGDPLGLAEVRTKSFGTRRKIFVNSTPTVQGASRIEQVFATTDMRRFYVPCPFCGVYQVLVWEQMRHEDGKPYSAWYECIRCAGHIEDHHKLSMLARGEWRPEKTSDTPRRIGFELSGLYAPVGMSSWGELSLAYHEALHEPQKMRVWVNTALGQSYADKGERPEWEKLYLRRGEYETGTVPEGVLLITAGIDVQKDRIEAEVVGWGRNKESWSINYYVFMGDTTNLQGEAWNGLRDLMSHGFVHPTGVVMQIQCAAIDCGYNTSFVYQWAREYESPRVSVIKGEDSRTHVLGSPGHVDIVTSSGKRLRRALKRIPVGVSVLKQELYGWLRHEKPEAGATLPGYCHWPDYNEEYFKQLTAEQFVTIESRTTHKERGEWRKIRERNEALDCRIYARAAAAILRIDMFRGPEWDRLELSLGSRSLQPTETSSGVQAGPVARPERRRRYRSKGF